MHLSKAREHFCFLSKCCPHCTKAQQPSKSLCWSNEHCFLCSLDLANQSAVDLMCCWLVPGRHKCQFRLLSQWLRKWMSLALAHNVFCCCLCWHAIQRVCLPIPMVCWPSAFVSSICLPHGVSQAPKGNPSKNWKWGLIMLQVLWLCHGKLKLC